MLFKRYLILLILRPSASLVLVSKAFAVPLDISLQA